MPEKESNKRQLDVSIVSANFNNANYLASFIRSVEHSTALPRELILVDDGSTDGSREVIDSFRHLRWLRPVFAGGHIGFTAALNEGVRLASGKYIMRADPDDILLPERIETQFRYMEENPTLDVSGCNVAYFKGQAEHIVNISNFPITHSDILGKYTRGEHGVQHPTVIARSELMKRYPYGAVFPGEDYELFARMIRDGAVFSNLRQPLYMMRIHSGSSTSNLRYEGIKQTFAFRDRIFGGRTPGIKVRMYYTFIKNYRRYQLADNTARRYFHLAVSSLFYPQKLFNRIIHAEGVFRSH